MLIQPGAARDAASVARPLVDWRQRLRHDGPASIVVFLLALPLSMGIAIASGVPPAAGLISAMIGGMVVGALAGSPLQVSGPAAGLTVMVFEIVQREGLPVLGAVVLVAGLLQCTAGALRLGQWFRAVSPAVIRALLTGIGILIVASQFHVMVDDAPHGGGLSNLLSLPGAIYKGVFPLDNSVHHHAARIGLLTMLITALWRPLMPARLRAVPAPLAAITVATLLTIVADLPINRVALPEKFSQAISLISPGSLARLLDGRILLAGIAMAFVASAETLLCATAVDRLHAGPRTRYDREMIAQGVGNTLCGLLGALPVTGVIVRSAANVEAGARSRGSAILHGAWMAIAVFGLSGLLRLVPTAGLAAILVYTGFKLIDLRAIRELARFGRSEAAIYTITVIVIVTVDLLTGVLVGVGLAAAKLLYTLTHLNASVSSAAGTSRTDLTISGAATFLGLPRLAAQLERVPASHELHVHVDRLRYIDHACLDLLMNWEKQHASTGGRLVLDWENLTARVEPAYADRGPQPARPPPEPGPRPVEMSAGRGP